MQFKLKPKAATILKKPSEIEPQPVVIDRVHSTANGAGIAAYCPDCGVEHSWIADWPIGVRIHCAIDGCNCRFFINDDVEIIE